MPVDKKKRTTSDTDLSTSKQETPLRPDQQGRLWVRGKGSRQRWVLLKQEGLCALLLYLDHYRFVTEQKIKGKRMGEEPLCLSERGDPLQKNSIELLFGRLRKRAGMSQKGMNPALLRDTFAVRYLQTGGDLFTLRELLGQEESARVKRILHLRE